MKLRPKEIPGASDWLREQVFAATAIGQHFIRTGHIEWAVGHATAQCLGCELIFPMREPP